MFNYYHLKRKLIVWYYTESVYPYNDNKIRKLKRQIRQLEINTYKVFIRRTESFKVSTALLNKFIAMQTREVEKIIFLMEHIN